MRKKLILSLFVLTFAAVKGQNNFIMPDSSNQVILNASGGVGSSGIPQNFMNKFLFPDFIDNELKNEASGSLKDENTFGGHGKGNVNVLFAALKDTAKTSSFLGVGFGTNVEGNLNFTKDLFDVVFYGNKPYAGQTLNLNNTRFNALSYSFIEFSYGKSKFTPEAHSSLWADFGLVLGHTFIDFDFKNASLFTEANGDYLNVNISESSIAMSDTLSTNLVNGYGVKLDLHYSRQTANSKLLVSAENLGGILWNNASSADVDTNFTFDGIEVGNIFELSDSVWSELGSMDSIIETEKSNNFKALPVDFTVYYKRQMDLLYFDVFAKHRLFANYTPFVRAGVNFELPIVKPGITVAYGGYSGLQVGLNTDIVAIKSMRIQIGTNNVLGAIIPSSSTALDMYAGMRYKF